jgi:hypothetical protein
MADVRCPACGKPNPEKLETCQFCQSRLKPTMPLEPIHPGEQPVPKNTSDLEQSLPQWLRNARKGEDAPSADAPDTSADLPFSEEKPKKKQTDLLAGLQKIGGDEEEIPDWMAGLNLPGLKQSESEAEPKEESTGWLSDLRPEDGGTSEEAAAPIEPGQIELGPRPGTGELISSLPGWMSSNLSDHGTGDLPPIGKADELSPEPQDETSGGDTGELPSWLANLANKPVTETPSEDSWASSAQRAGGAEQFAGTGAETPPAVDDIAMFADTQPAQKPSLQGSGDLPGWLSGTGEPAAAADFAQPSDDGAPDWLSKLEEEQPAAPAAGGDLPDWMSAGPEGGISVPPMGDPGIFEDTKPAQKPSLKSSGEDASDWLSSLGAEPAAPAFDAGTPAGDDTPDWMASLGTEPAAPAPAAFDAGIPADGDTPDWLSGLGAEPASPAAAAFDAGTPADGDTPDWMASLGAEPAAPAPAAFDAGAPADGDTPDWLSGLGAEPASPAAAAFDAGTPADGVSPDWLSGLGAEPASPAAAAFDAGAPTTGETPDWMAGLGAEPAASETDAGGGTPDWMTGLGAGSTPSSAPPATGALDQVMPNWMAGLTGAGLAAEAASETGAAPSLGDESSQSPFGAPVEGVGESVDSEQPEWLSKLSNETTVPPLSEGAPVQPASTSPALIMNEGGQAGSDADSIFSMEMPDWLSSSMAGERAEGSADAAGGELKPAELPSWVQAMRPVETAGSGASSSGADQSAEKEGPLAGLSGVLPVGAGFRPTRKPQAFGLKLQVTDAQQSQAVLLEQMLSAEAEPRPMTSAQGMVSVRLLRWILAGLLILAVGLTSLLGSTLLSFDMAIPGGVSSAADAVGELQAGEPVLVAFDYDPALSGEMDAIGSAIVDHLMQRGMRLALISTNLNGPALSARAIAPVAAKYNYVEGDQYANLGYLPGGSSGVLGFSVASDLPMFMRRGSVWGVPFLQGVKTIDRFALVVVITDDAEVARVWVEQAGPVLAQNNRSLVLAVSAQAEPMVQPYLASGQVKGLVGGLYGAAAYERNQFRTDGTGRKYWDPYMIGLLVALFSIMVGGVWSLITGRRMRQEKAFEEA